MYSMESVKTLRDESGLSLKQVAEALTASSGDLQGARNWLRANAKAKIESQADPAAEGRVAVYKHHNNRIAVVVQLACQTDFTANNAEFVQLADSIAMHIAAAKPKWIDIKSIDPVAHANELTLVQERTAAEGIPEARRKQVNDGRMRAFYVENVLLEQPFVRDPTRTIGQMVNDLSAKTKEPIVVKRFERFEVGR